MTPLYAAPEQLRGDVISTLTDVYSLGVRAARIARRVHCRIAQPKAWPGLAGRRARSSGPRASCRARASRRSKARGDSTGNDGAAIARRARRRPRHHHRQGAAARAGSALRLGRAPRRGPAPVSRAHVRSPRAGPGSATPRGWRSCVTGFAATVGGGGLSCWSSRPVSWPGSSICESVRARRTYRSGTQFHVRPGQRRRSRRGSGR